MKDGDKTPLEDRLPAEILSKLILVRFGLTVLMTLLIISIFPFAEPAAMFSGLMFLVAVANFLRAAVVHLRLRHDSLTLWDAAAGYAAMGLLVEIVSRV